MKLLYFSPSSYGGLADYADAQAQALATEGVEVTLLCAPDFPVRPGARYIRLPKLPPHRENSPVPRPIRALHMGRRTVGNHLTLAKEIKEGKHSFVLFGSYAEYFAPVWAPALRQHKNVRWGAVVHDPVRDTIMGPAWWHRRSVASAYSLLDLAFVHEETVLNTESARWTPRTIAIPHGPYSFPLTGLDRVTARKHLGLPADLPVLLQFGHLRDSKNLDLVIDTLSFFPKARLLIAGKEQSRGQRPAAHYQEQARRSGVSERCRWWIGHIPANEVELYFKAADCLLLCYDKSFRSASGVLNVAAQFRLPCLATSGPGPLQSAVEKYYLGVWKPADDPVALREGLQTLLENPPAAKWDEYLKDHDWQTNARTVIRAFLEGDRDSGSKSESVKAPSLSESR